MSTAVVRIPDHRVMRYGGAIALVAFALLLRLQVDHLLGDTLPPYITFYPAVMIAAVLVGFWPGVLATVLSAVVVDYFLLPPVGSFAIRSAKDAVAMTFFVGMGLLMCVIAGRYRRSLRLLTRVAESQIELFVEHAPAAIAMFDSQMRYLRASRRWRSDYGLGDRVLLGESHYTIFPDLPPYWKEAHRRCLAGETLKSDADCFLRADGTTQWLRWEIRPWRIPDGTVGGLLIFAEDITARKHADEQLQRLTRTYSVLSDINQTIMREKDQQAMLAAACRIAVHKGNFLMAWIAMLDPDTHQIKSITSSGDTDAYLEAAGVGTSSRLNLEGPAARCITSARHVVYNDLEQDPAFLPWKDEALRRGFRSLAAFPLKTHGRVLGAFILYAGQTGFFDDRELVLLDEMAMDISFALEIAQQEAERRKVEEELRWRTAFFEAQLESSVDSIMVKNDKDEIIFRNRRLLRLWDIPEAFAFDRDDARIFPCVLAKVKNKEQFMANRAAIYANPDEFSQDEVELLDGTLLTRSTSPVKDASGKFYGRLWVFQDITQRRNLERQLRQSQKMEAVGQLTGGIAHDFNNLLGIIMGNLDLVEGMIPENKGALKRVQSAMAASRRGADVTRRLLSFSRSGELKPTPTLLHQSVVSVVDLARTLGPDIRFALKLDPSLPAVLVDASALENALLNLIVNARDAMPGGGTVTIATQPRTLKETDALVLTGELTCGTYACITLSDTGEGMPSNILDRAFEPFFTTKEQGKGTGLGLSMVYGFVKQSGGGIRLYSEPSHGTTITIYLPLNQADLPEETSLTPDPLLHQRTGRVLLVDDEPGHVELAELYLRAVGYQVFTAGDAETALRIAQQERDFDLVITDIVMPGNMNGVELARRLREDFPELKVIYSSGYPADAMADRGLPAIDGQLLRKPYLRGDFDAAVRSVMT